MFGSNLQLLSYKPMRRFHSWNHCAPSFFAGKFHESSTSIVWGAEIMVWNFMNTKVLDIVYTVSSIVSSLFNPFQSSFWGFVVLLFTSVSVDLESKLLRPRINSSPALSQGKSTGETSKKKMVGWSCWESKPRCLKKSSPRIGLSYSGRSSICAS